MCCPQARPHTTDPTAFNQQLLLSGPSEMNQPAGLSMLQQQLLSLTPDRQGNLSLLLYQCPDPLPLLSSQTWKLQCLWTNLARRMEGLEKELSTLKRPRNDGEDDSDDGVHHVSQFAFEIGKEQDQDIDEDDAAEPPKMAFNFQDVRYTHGNLVAFAKSKFRSYKRKYIEKIDEEKAAKCRQFNTANKHLRRQEHLAEDREKAVEEYKARNEKDPTDLLRPEYMSEQASEVNTDDEEKRKDRQKKLYQAAKLTEREVHAGIPVWEIIRPVWRADEVTKILEELDSIRDEQRKESKRKTALTRCVNLGNKSNTPPSLAIFPFMLDVRWHKEYQAENLGSGPVEIYENNPDSFGQLDAMIQPGGNSNDRGQVPNDDNQSESSNSNDD
ncbi:hypothetical protein DFJ58DRAFT_842115 [Suillus subalutaceus]|uniref:uncharacterized protein n=1 Tax=Suillus subalutaceus TaxID=48586 RepID=UPI001B86D858|nr:uncharacterized protein DFJ58DRAFT_842115 [Suillus subalutaceus]KAG1851632.1 hypothetical protein DFJ58DRAFT_842115 [Suillus subalutaceus]